MTNKQLIEKQIDEIFNKGNFNYADQVCTNNMVFHEITMLDAPIGPESVKLFARVYREAFPDLHVEIEDIIEQNDKVAVCWKATGTQKGVLFGVAPTKKLVTLTGLSFYKIVKGAIAEVFVQWDILKLMRELDVTLPIKLEAELHV